MDDLGQNDDNIDDDIDDNIDDDIDNEIDIDDDIDNEIDIDDDDEIDYEIYQTDYAAAGDSAETSFTNPDAVKKASDAEGLNLRQKNPHVSGRQLLRCPRDRAIPGTGYKQICASSCPWYPYFPLAPERQYQSQHYKR